MSTSFSPQPDADHDSRTLMENEGVNAGSAVPETSDDDRSHGQDKGQDVGAGDRHGRPTATANEDAHLSEDSDAAAEPSDDSDAELYGAESGQDSGSMS
jgi:hypothetical protein